MKLAVAGAPGYIGDRLVPSLLAAGHQVVCLARTLRRPRLSGGDPRRRLAGRRYWYAVFPFHRLIFGLMARRNRRRG